MRVGEDPILNGKMGSCWGIIYYAQFGGEECGFCSEECIINESSPPACTFYIGWEGCP